MELDKAKDIARKVVKELEPFCDRIEVAGSVRRGKPFPRDIDIVLIPRDRAALDQTLIGMGGHYKMAGMKITRVEMDSIPLDIYFAIPETFATLLLIRTGSTLNNIRLCSVAKKKGWHLAASGEGLFDANRQRIAWKTEESIYEALGLPYQRPEERG
ncbi:hypothetical protein ES705_12375 [subsurface metagenome]